MDFQNSLPYTDNPNTGFVGSPSGLTGQIPPASYGVHAAPVAALLRSYGLNATSLTGMSWDDLRREISARKPVIAWVIGHNWTGSAYSYTASDGETLLVAPYEHTVIVLGYTQYTVSVLDGSTIYTPDLEQFLASWSVLNYMAVESK